LKKILTDYWAIFASIAVLILTALLMDLRHQNFDIFWSVFIDKYDGKSFVYWPVSDLTIEWLVIPIGTLIIIVTWILVRLLKRSFAISYTTGYSILAMIVLSILAVIIIVFSGMGDPAFIEKEVATAQIRGNNYHLIGIYPMGDRNQYVLIKCQMLNTNCQVTYRSGGLYAARINEAKLQTKTSSNGDIIVLIMDNKIVYTSE
jgi:hypothetical protein